MHKTKPDDNGLVELKGARYAHFFKVSRNKNTDPSSPPFILYVASSSSKEYEAVIKPEVRNEKRVYWGKGAANYRRIRKIKSKY